MTLIGKIIDKKGIVYTIKILSDRLQVGDVLRIKKAGKKRTLKQNALYWLFCQFCATELGMEAEELHEVLKQRFLSYKKVIEKNNKMFVVQAVKSTTKLTKSEFAEYFDKCNHLLIEYGVNTYEFWKTYEEMTNDR